MTRSPPTQLPSLGSPKMVRKASIASDDAEVPTRPLLLIPYRRWDHMTRDGTVAAAATSATDCQVDPPPPPPPLECAWDSAVV